MSTGTGRAPDHEMFVKTLAAIERDPQRHDQASWFNETSCGTTACFAGHAVTTVAGLKQHPVSDSFIQMPTGKWLHVADAACEVLGIYMDDDDDRSAGPRLFYDCQTLGDLYSTCAEILGIDEQVLRDKVRAELAP